MAAARWAGVWRCQQTHRHVLQPRRQRRERQSRPARGISTGGCCGGPLRAQALIKQPHLLPLKPTQHSSQRGQLHAGGTAAGVMRERVRAHGLMVSVCWKRCARRSPRQGPSAALHPATARSRRQQLQRLWWRGLRSIAAASLCRQRMLLLLLPSLTGAVLHSRLKAIGAGCEVRMLHFSPQHARPPAAAHAATGCCGVGSSPYVAGICVRVGSRTGSVSTLCSLGARR